MRARQVLRLANSISRRCLLRRTLPARAETLSRRMPFAHCPTRRLAATASWRCFRRKSARSTSHTTMSQPRSCLSTFIRALPLLSTHNPTCLRSRVSGRLAHRASTAARSSTAVAGCTPRSWPTRRAAVANGAFCASTRSSTSSAPRLPRLALRMPRGSLSVRQLSHVRRMESLAVSSRSRDRPTRSFPSVPMVFCIASKPIPPMASSPRVARSTRLKTLCRAFRSRRGTPRS